MITKNRHLVTDNVILGCLFFIFLSVSISRHSENLRDVIHSDAEGYYIYLPAVFVYGNIHHLPDRVFTGSIKTAKGEIYTKYTCSVALLCLPFFLAAHLYAHIFHVDPSGFSSPYCYAIIISGVFWSFIGLFFLKNLFLKYFDRVTTWITLLCIMLGTNFYCYATLFNGMSHVYNFTLFAAAILVTDLYYKAPGKGKAILLALLVGWIVLARPTNIAMIVFLLLFNVVTIKEFKQRMLFLKGRISDLLISIPFFIAVLIPQMIYWKEMTGKWIKYSYGNEHFEYWANPKIAAVLFDTQNGLFLYSPVLLFFFWALIMRRKDPRTNFRGVSIVFTVITYMFASWWAWWFGGAFGHRCYVDYFPMLGFPLAVTMEHIKGMKRYLWKVPLFLIIALFCYYSVALSTIFLIDGIWDGPNWRWNWDAWGVLVKKIF